MPWKEELPMDQKTQFVSEYLRDSLIFHRTLPTLPHLS